jgi:hypothetical protein
MQESAIIQEHPSVEFMLKCYGSSDLTDRINQTHRREMGKQDAGLF